MNHLMKLIQINHSFQKSVNLQLDLDNYERIGSYIPTRSSIAILKRYWNIVSVALNIFPEQQRGLQHLL